MSPWIHSKLPTATGDFARLTNDMDTFGYCIIENALPPETTRAIRARIEEQAAAETAQGEAKVGDAQAFGAGNQWVYLLINKGPIFRELLCQKTARDVVAHVLGPTYLLSNFAASITHPGNQQMGLHVDQWWLPAPRATDIAPVRPGTLSRTNIAFDAADRSLTPINPPVVCNVLWMISDFTIDNGATRVVPYSHLSGSQPDPSSSQETVNITGKAGTALVFEGRTWHAADINRSNGPRYGITTFYCGPQFRQMDNYTFGTRKDVVAELDPDLLKLLGFSPWSGYGATGEPGADIRPGEETTGELHR